MTGEAGALPAGPVALFATRLAVLGSVFALAVLVELRPSGEYEGREAQALYALIVAGVLQAVAHLTLRLRGGGAERGLARVEAAGDGALISALVYCAGGVDSFFVFLYDVWIVHVAMRVGSGAAFGAAIFAAGSYAAISLGPLGGWLPPFESGHVAPSWEHASYPLMLQSSGFAFVAGLAYTLARQVQVGRHELLELGELHRRIVDNVASGLLTVDPERRITSFNREAERITGFEAAEVLGAPLEVVLGSAIELERGGRPRGPRRLARVRRRGGEPLHLGFSSSPLRSASGSEEGAIVVFQDLTRVVEMEEQLRRSERLSAVGQLAAGLAHEIRNPLASLSGSLELLGTERAFEDAGSRRLLRIVQRETERLNRLVSEFLEYARASPGRRLRVPLSALFGEIGELLAASEHRGLELRVELPAHAVARGDPDHLRQIFWNLLLNAAEASEPGGVIEVEARERGGGDVAEPELEVEIRDRGAGIPAELLERVFEPFFTTKPKGTGLGLATVHRLVEAAGGALALHSEPGVGTCARVTLPAFDGPGEA